MKIIQLIILTLTVTIFTNCNSVKPINQPISDLEKFTGTYTRVVWLEGFPNRDWGGSIMGYDSKTDNVHEIQPFHTHNWRPILCFGGNAVAFSTHFKTYISDWDGNNKHFISNGRLEDIWKDPKTGLEWAIIHDVKIELDTGLIIKCRIDSPTIRDTIFEEWSMTGANDVWFRLSQNGTKAIADLPWDSTYLLDYTSDLKLKSNILVSSGCWNSISQNSDINIHWAHLNWPHHSFTIFENETIVDTIIPNIDFPPGDGKEISHPRFASNGSHIFLFTAGYPQNTGSDSSEIFIAKLSQDFKHINSWFRLTNDTISQNAPDAWVGVDESIIPKLPDSIITDYTINDSAIKNQIKVISPVDSILVWDTHTITIKWSASPTIAGVTLYVTSDKIEWFNITDRAIKMVNGLGEVELQCKDLIKRLKNPTSPIFIKISSYQDASVNDVTGAILIYQYE